MFWSRFIIGLFSAFVLLIIAMVTIAMRQKDISLVSPTYYKEELAYQEVIDAIGRTPKQAISLAQVNDELVVRPSATEAISPLHADSVNVEVRRPELAKQDRNYSGRQLTTNGLSFKALKTGKWQIIVKWQHNGLTYYWRDAYYVQ